MRGAPHGCCQHLRARFQWKPNSLSLARICCMGGTLNSSQTHRPTTWAWSQISGISVFSRSSKAIVSVMLAVFADMVTLFPPSTRANGMLLVFGYSLAGSADGIPFFSEVLAHGHHDREQKRQPPSQRERLLNQSSSGSMTVVDSRLASVMIQNSKPLAA